MLKDTLQQLAATGSSGFEGLIQRLLGRLTGYQFYLAQSGAQAGRDLSSERINATVLAVECKRYGDETELKVPELLGKLAQAAAAIPRLDVWVLVASRSVHDQLYSELQNLGARLHIDVQVLSAGNEFPSSLDIICAHSPDVVISYLRAHNVRGGRSITRELERIATTPDFAQRRDRLRAAFTTSAGYDAVRIRLREWHLAQFTSGADSRVTLGQVVDVESKRTAGLFVPREQSFATFDRWLTEWPTRRAGLAVLGEEGDGKTWATASWLSRKLYSDTALPPVLWIPSREAIEPDLELLIGSALAKRLTGTSISWLERLRRWSQPSTSISPVLIVVLDGINERHNAGWWRPILEGLGSSEWRNAITPIVTARSGFWPALARLPHIAWNEWTVPPFNDEELELALRQTSVSRDELPVEILALVRKPRYFDMAVRHRTAMAASGDVTVARLIYEDWRDREMRRSGLPDEADFQAVIMDLAMRHRRGIKNLAKSDVLDAIGALDDRDRLLCELETGGILIHAGRGWRVEPSRLALGFGILLAERILEAASATAPAEVLASLMEPQPDIDIKSAILENGALHSLKAPGFTTEVRAVLLSAWLTHRNPGRPPEQAVAAYFPLDPPAYLAAAETIWADSTNDGWAEELLRAAYARWSTVGAFSADFRRAFERWLSFVHIDGSPVAIKAEDRSVRGTELSAILGKERAPGPFEYAGTNLTAVDDDGLLRLGRVALSMISAEDRRPHTRALTAAFVADALMQFPDRLDICRWILRTSSHDLWPSLKPELDRLIRVGTRTTLQAAYRLLGSVGTAEALALRETLPTDLFPTPKWVLEYELDPCASGFAWRREHCVRCAIREDVPMHIMAQQLGKCVMNPMFQVPEATCRRLSMHAAEIDAARIWSGTFTSEQELKFDTLEPVLSSCAPNALGDLIRGIARELPNREGLALRQLGHELLQYRLALTSTDGSEVHAAWEARRGLDRSQDKETERAEWSLFELLIQTLPAEAQLDRLLERHENALVLTRFRRHFKPIAWSVVAERLRQATQSSDVSRILFFAGANAQVLDATASNEIIPHLTNPDGMVRFLALRLTYTQRLEGAAMTVVDGSWHFNGQDEDVVHEDHWGSLVLSRWGQQLPYEELRTRINPIYLGRAILNRGSKKQEVNQYAEDIHDVWRQLETRDPDVGSPPAIELRAAAASRTDELELPRVPQSAFSRSVTFLSRHASWGGTPPKVSGADIMRGPSDDDIQRLHDQLGQVIAQQRKARNFWFAQRFSPDCLSDVIDARPDLVSEWIGTPIGAGESIKTRVWLARSFYESLCEVLLSKNPGVGITLYQCLRSHSGAVRFVEHGTDIALLDYSLFSAPECDEVRAEWDTYLEAARSDRDLLVIAMLAQSGSASAWLATRRNADLSSDIPFRKVRAVVLGGFLDSATLPTEPPAARHDVIEWQREQHARAVKNWSRNQWARAWFDRFASDDSDDRALGAFRLFLTCVDSRFSRWREAATVDIRADRQRFFMTSRDDIERAIKKNEQDLRKYFLGMQVAGRQVWPWL